jgi:hypothetical protein
MQSSLTLLTRRGGSMFNRRSRASVSRLALIIVAVVVAAVFAVLRSASAATPSSGTLTDTSGPVTYTAGPFVLPNQTPLPAVDSGPQCDNPAQPCDDFNLTVSLPSNYAEQNPNKLIRFSAAWTDTGTSQSDYDLYIYKGTVTNTDGSEAAFAQSASKADPEVTSIPVFDGSQTFTVKVVPFQPTGETLNVSIALVDGTGSGSGGGALFGSATPTTPDAPRYQTLAAPDGSSANAGSGEFNVGFDPKTGNIMENSWGDVFRVTPPELRHPALPEAGPAEWTDVSPSISSLTTADPILVTDPATGRTFISNQTTGAEALFAFTDDDGATWTQASAAPPDGGVDHETIGVGPYPATLSSLATVYPNAVYYCSQAEAPDFCQRSDTGGLQFGPGTIPNNGTGCSGLHGHVKVAPNGTVYLPNKSCGATEGGAVSTDAGTTWKPFSVPASGSSNSDPSIGIDKDNTAYYCYTPRDGSPHVAVSHDGGATWVNDFDIGAAAGVKQAVFPEAVAGDSGRASCGFLGTNVAGNLQATDFPGKWFLFIATTYDGGKTWTTVNATPNDPVQGAGGICLGGLGCGSNRNLLDFNEVTTDNHGRVLFGYDDGCVTDRCIQSGGDQNDFVASARIARQTGGKPLFAQYDPVEPAAPKQPYLAGARDQNGIVLTWNAPDNGGSDITSYQVLRSTSSGGETKVATVSGDKDQYVDATAIPSVTDYFYEVVAVNAVGSSTASNEVDLKVVQTAPPPSPCTAPGPTILTDASGDSLTGTPGTDLRSLELSQPFASNGKVELRFQLDTDPGINPQPPASYWYVSFKTPSGTVHGVRMWFDPTSPAQPTFQSYVASANTSGSTDGRFVESGSMKPADPNSSYDPTTGTVVILVPLADVGLSEGDTILGLNAASAQEASTPAGGGAEVVDGMPDSLAYTSSYTIRTNSSCASNTPPTASLTASPTTGTAPLDVSFDGSGSKDADAGDSVASYTFNFGDGTTPVTQSSPTVSHTYEIAGHYQPSLTVTDGHGAQSSNGANVTLDITPSTTVFEDDNAHIAYANGWHTVNSSTASAGHFHTASGKGLSFAFSTTGKDGTLAFYYGTSTKGGSADLYLDGSLVQTVSFRGSQGDGHTPVFGASINAPMEEDGAHTVELRNVNGEVYVDKLTVTNGTSDAQPSTSPGQTQTSSASLTPGAANSTTLTAPANAVALTVLTESSLSVPYTLAILNTKGSVLTTATSSADGIASVEVPAAAGAKYVVQLLDVGAGPVTIWSAVTPDVSH